MLLNAKKAVMFCAHTDDEMVAAGTLHRLVREGAEVHVVAMGPCAIETDRLGGMDSERAAISEWLKSLELIGAQRPQGLIDPPLGKWYAGIIPSSRLAEHAQRMAQFVYHWIEREKPDCAFILSPNDENTAHAELGRQCERVMRGRVTTVVRCNYPWNLAVDRPNLYVQLSDEDWQVKKAVAECYKSQRFRYNYAGIFEHQAVMEGLVVKSDKPCETFTLLRSVL